MYWNPLCEIEDEQILERLHYALMRCCFSKRLLSEKLGVRYATVCSWYRGSRPSKTNIAKIDAFLGRNNRSEGGSK